LGKQKEAENRKLKFRMNTDQKGQMGNLNRGNEGNEDGAMDGGQRTEGRRQRTQEPGIKNR
jgi:hypothetical protein